MKGEGMQRDVQFGVQFSFYFNRSEAKRDETKRENVVADVENICGTLDQDQGLAYILFFPVNGACLRLSFNVCVCVFAADKISKNCRRLFNQPPEEG